MKDRYVILVVDDQYQNIELLEAYLIPQGYEIVSAINGKDALEWIAHKHVDLILLDVMMPGMDGFEVIRKIRQDNSNQLLPIILVTALRDTEDRVKGIEAGCDDFITKPFEKVELLARIRALLKVKAYNDLVMNYRKELESEVNMRTVELKHAFESIKTASLETIHRLAVASEYKDAGTGAHIKRMSLYSAAIARQMGLNEETVEIILNATPMHDLGKIWIPDRILLKPGKLDPLEWEIMKHHAVVGAEILKGSDAEVIKAAEIIARCHHERWDGKGYPEGLKGTDIPLSCCITAIADVFDAVTSERIYMAPLSMDESFDLISEGRGSQFNPDVVDAFFAIKDEILAIKKQYDDDNRQIFHNPELKVLLEQYYKKVNEDTTKYTYLNRSI